MNQLLQIPGYTWRSWAEGDAAALAAFEAACGRLDGMTQRRTLAEWQALTEADDSTARSTIAVNEAGEAAAAGWFAVEDRVDSVHAFLEGRVHPDFRGQGIGAALLAWLGAQAHGSLAAFSNDRPLFLRLIFYDRAPDAIALFEQQGYERQYAEDEYAFELKRPLPFLDISPELVWESWTPDNAVDFYAAYRAAFATRTDNLMSEAAWSHHFASPDDDAFRPALSVLLRREETLPGYAVVHAETPVEAWITQIGVNAELRRRGWGAAIMVRVLHKMADAGFSRALLQVNQDNAQARALYEALGFAKIKTLYAYRKQVG
jgi:mycothiol synthase